MRTSNLRHIIVCLLIANFASGSNALPNSYTDPRDLIYGKPKNSFEHISWIAKLNWDSYNLSKNHYAPRNSDSDYLKAFKDHLRNLHDNLDNLTLECCRENRNDKSAICVPKIVKPSEEVKIKDESKNRRKETGLLGTGGLDVHCGGALGNPCNRIDGCPEIIWERKRGIIDWFK